MRLWLVLAVGLAGCGDDDASVDAGATEIDAGEHDGGSDAGEVDAGEVDSGAADAGEDASVELSVEQLDAISRSTTLLGAATALTAPMLASAQGVRDDASSMADGPRRDRAQSGVEDGFSGNSVVTEAGCVTYDWNRLSVTITLSDCVLEATGESASGMLVLEVSFFPTMFSLTIDALTVGESSIDAALVLNVGGDCSMGDSGCMPCRDSDPECGMSRIEQSTLSGELSLTNMGSSTLTIDALMVSYDGAGATVSGELETGGISISVMDVHWNQGECLPSSGTATLDDTTTIELLETTPATGNVNVTIDTPLGPLGPVEQMLLEPCE